MEIVGLTGIGMVSGIQMLSPDGGTMMAAVLLGTLAASASGILASRLVAGWKRSSFRPALRLHPAALGGR